jgi:hypothetical protein
MLRFTLLVLTLSSEVWRRQLAMPKKIEVDSPERVKRLLKELDNYIPGKGCECFAYYEGECGCSDVDWTPSREKRLEVALEYVRAVLTVRHKDKEGIPELLETIKLLTKTHSPK